jgi:SAM-dependent methyltransferase
MGNRDRWQERYAVDPRVDRAPSRWVVATVGGLPNELPVLDVAGGSGRHAIPLARAGRRVVLADFVESAVRLARAAEPSIEAVVADVADLPLAAGRFGVVLVANFLDRSATPGLAALLAPGGHLVYETYLRAHLDLVDQGLAHGPSSPAYLLRSGELPSLFPGLDVRYHAEGEVIDEAGRRVSARLVARRGP